MQVACIQQCASRKASRKSNSKLNSKTSIKASSKTSSKVCSSWQTARPLEESEWRTAIYTGHRICVLILLHMCPHTATCVLILLHMCPHTATFVSSCCHRRRGRWRRVSGARSLTPRGSSETCTRSARARTTAASRPLCAAKVCATAKS
jgi:hypothetical protein